MTDISTTRQDDTEQAARRAARLKKRYRAERRFRFYGQAAIGMAGLILVFLLGSIIFRPCPPLPTIM